MTKNIEGTVDDDIAAKLAIGEGRQVRVLKQKSRSTSPLLGMWCSTFAVVGSKVIPSDHSDNVLSC